MLNINEIGIEKVKHPYSQHSLSQKFQVRYVGISVGIWKKPENSKKKKIIVPWYIFFKKVQDKHHIHTGIL